MKHPVRIAFFVTGTALLVIQSSHASAFQTIVHTPLSILTKFQPSTSTIRNHRNILSVTSNTRMSSAATTSFGTENTAPLFRLRGGSSDTDPAAFKPVSPPVKKIRIAAFDSMRFFLIINIVLGHFGRFANPPARLMTAFSQHNVIVGAFFALSGYVTVRTLMCVFVCPASCRLWTYHFWGVLECGIGLHYNRIRKAHRVPKTSRNAQAKVDFAKDLWILSAPPCSSDLVFTRVHLC